jgi:hypothetical protein
MTEEVIVSAGSEAGFFVRDIAKAIGVRRCELILTQCTRARMFLRKASMPR